MRGTVLLIRTVPFIFGAPLPFTAIGIVAAATDLPCPIAIPVVIFL